MSIRVALDAVGGDDAPDVVVDGAIAASHHEGIEVVLVGPKAVVERSMARHDQDLSGLTVVDAPDVVGMTESPSVALRQKQRSSLHVGATLLSTGKVDAFASAGNTGAVMAIAYHVLGRIDGVSRPSVMGLFPSVKGDVVVLDVGTNVDCKPEHLHQFAVMGTTYAQRILGATNPSVALLNVGEEPGKGNALSKEAFTLLKADTGLNFIGNVEGRDILAHAADVIVCDGFVGNVILKLGESVASALPRMIGAEIARLQLGVDEQEIVGRVLRGVRSNFDYEKRGGAPLLGVRGNVVIGHGGSSSVAIENMVLAAAKLAKQDVQGALANAFAEKQGA
jgi:glycerol-3-phosphate acyltransferase PlsX